ncbi:MAG: phosphopantothenoylcysteine decarboxylase [Candidatus Buchananbacteria bacterium]|nr:phosphopantothenoylcysteine decarboxylase [Candidatus Buchananbacteria bacterium]
MKVLVTAGSTEVPIDKVRVISNIFGGRTGTAIAEYFFSQGDEVTLITSNPSLVKVLDSKLKVISFRTYDQLLESMSLEIITNNFDVIIHSAAVSDYYVSDVYVMGPDGSLVLVDKSKKISSAHSSLFLEMKPTLKIIDLIRKIWGFSGRLVKFKLEVGISDEELIAIAQKSREASEADLIVANCLEWSDRYAYIISESGSIRVSRKGLAKKLMSLLT